MRCLYVVPVELLRVNRPAGHWESHPCPGDETLALVVVHNWPSYAAQDTWEALPGVTQHHTWNMPQALRAEHVRALAPWGVTHGHSHHEAHLKVRAKWPVWRH